MNHQKRWKIDSIEKSCTTETRIRLRIPKRCYQDLIISNLVSQYSLEVNIMAALLEANGREDGWFDLKVSGQSRQIESALVYLSDLDVEVWLEVKSGITIDGW